MTKHITTATRLTVLKHLAKGKSPDVVAAATELDRFEVLDIGNHHGYPDPAKLARAVQLVTSRMDREARESLAPGTPESVFNPSSTRAAPPPAPRPEPESTPAPSTDQAQAPATTQPAAAPSAAGGMLGEEIGNLVVAGRASSSKRIQSVANRIASDLEKLKTLLDEQRTKAEAASKAAEQKATLERKKARLEKELAAVQAQLRKPRRSPPVAAHTEGAPTAKEIRDWACTAGVMCPAAGRIPNAVREAYEAAHNDEVAA